LALEHSNRMNLSDRDIIAYGNQLIEPFDSTRVQPASYDLSLSEKILVPHTYVSNKTIDLRTTKPIDYMKQFIIDDWILVPGASILASTNEIIKCPNNLIARVEGKSSIGRLFVCCHVSAGFVDPGFQGQITLEIVNHGPWNVVLWKNMSIAQINFAKLNTECKNPYGSSELGSHYQGQTGPTAASGDRNKKEEEKI